MDIKDAKAAKRPAAFNDSRRDFIRTGNRDVTTAAVTIPVETTDTLRRRLLLAGASLMLAGPVRAQTLLQPGPQTAVPGVPQPVFGTPGKDAGWIPTPDGMVEAMLRLGRTTREDFVVDLGSGDGRIPILAAQVFGAHAMGVEYNPDLVTFSQQRARNAGLADRVRFIQGDVFEVDFSAATVVTLFMPPSFNQKLRPRLLAMKPGTRVLSFIFGMGDWEPDESVFVEDQRGMLWIVPAQMGGTWTVNVEGPEPARYALRLDQQHQKLDGRITIDTAPLPLFDARIDADRIRFTALPNGRRHDFDGRLVGGRIEGTLRVTGVPALRTWKALR